MYAQRESDKLRSIDKLPSGKQIHELGRMYAFAESRGIEPDLQTSIRRCMTLYYRGALSSAGAKNHLDHCRRALRQYGFRAKR